MRSNATASSTVLLVVLLAYCWQMSSGSSEEAATPSLANQQMEDMSKRDWNKDLHIWGKRGWNNLHGSWALKRNTPSWDESQFQADKRAWNNLQSGWGKRFDSEDKYAINKLAAMLEQDPLENFQYDDQVPDVDVNDDEKRNWGQFHGGWGKRNKWEKFRGSWGKREPAWSNLKGIWGKRSFSDQIAQ